MSCESGKEIIPQIKVAVCLVFKRDGKILLVRQSQKASKDQGLWGLPGGHVNFGEPLVNTAKREVREELGENISIEIREQLGYMEQIDNNQHLLLIVFAGNLLGGEINPGHEIDDYAWVGEEEIENYPFRPSAEMFFNQVLRLGNFSLLL